MVTVVEWFGDLSCNWCVAGSIPCSIHLSCYVLGLVMIRGAGGTGAWQSQLWLHCNSTPPSIFEHPKQMLYKFKVLILFFSNKIALFFNINKTHFCHYFRTIKVDRLLPLQFIEMINADFEVLKHNYRITSLIYESLSSLLKLKRATFRS